MKSSALAITLLFVSALVISRAAAASNPDSLQPQVSRQESLAALERMIPQMLDSAEVPGMSLAVVENGKLVWLRGFGVRNLETKTPVTESSIFQAASLSKPVFAFAVHKLVEEGRFDLDKPLLEYLPQTDFETAFLKRPLDDERMRLLTARMVLSHTTGFPNWRNGEKRLQLNFDPGAHFSYSGEGFVLLQKVIAHLSKQTIQRFVAQRVFVPLGMTASSFVWREDYAAELAEAHGPLGNLEDRPRMTEGNAAFSLYTNAKDYGVFLAAMLKQQLLHKKTFEQMLKPQVQLPARWGDRSGQKAEGFYWGLGWGLQGTKMGESFWHWGDNGPYKCYVVGYPEQKRGLVFFTNSAHGLELARELVWRLWNDDHATLLRWLGYEAYNSASAILAQTARKKGVSAALAQFHELHQANSSYQLNESAVNDLGYLMMRMKRMEDALQLFQRNVESFPASWNVYDSYAEAQLRSGNHELAAENYAKSLALNANNGGAKQILSQLRPDRPRLGNAHFALKGYAQARLVTVAGSFNDWSDLHTLLEKKGEEWTCHLELPAGKHLYKFVVDGKWILDPANAQSENDGNGNVNSVLIIE